MIQNFAEKSKQALLNRNRKDWRNHEETKEEKGRICLLLFVLFVSSWFVPATPMSPASIFPLTISAIPAARPTCDTRCRAIHLVLSRGGWGTDACDRR